MKKLVLIAIALFSLNGFAQHKASKKERIKKAEKIRSEMTPEEMAELRTKKMTLHLDLTESQQKEVYNVLLEESRYKKEKHKAYKAAKKEKSEITKEEYLKHKNERLDRQIAMKAKMKAILNADQYDKFQKAAAEMKKRRPGRKGEYKHKKS